MFEIRFARSNRKVPILRITLKSFWEKYSKILQPFNIRQFDGKIETFGTWWPDGVNIYWKEEGRKQLTHYEVITLEKHSGLLAFSTYETVCGNAVIKLVRVGKINFRLLDAFCRLFFFPQFFVQRLANSHCHMCTCVTYYTIVAAAQYRIVIFFIRVFLLNEWELADGSLAQRIAQLFPN